MAIASRAYAPIAFHYLVLPHSPSNAGALLSDEREPVFTNYQAVDWAGLAKSARQQIDDYVPKAVKLYVANDGQDAFDLCNINARTGKPVTDHGDFYSRAQRAITNVGMANMRAGVLNLSGPCHNLHINEAVDGLRAPLTGLVLTLKVQNMFQAVDYLGSATNQLFGHEHVFGLIKSYPKLIQGANRGLMAPCIHQWFQQQFGVSYALECSALLLGATFTQ
jgi:hypothetical protein